MKYKDLADTLRNEIKQRIDRGEKRLPTEQFLMKEHQVSRQTVRQALSLLLAEGLIEKHQGSGTYISDAAIRAGAGSQHIALITPFADEYEFSSVLWDMQSLFTAAGYHSQVYSTRNLHHLEREILQNLIRHPVHGLIVRGTRTAFPNPNNDLYEKLSRMGTAIVRVGAFPNAPGRILSAGDTIKDYSHAQDSVPASISGASLVSGAGSALLQTDDPAGGYLLTQHLIRHGHKQIAGLFPLDDYSGHLRQYGCCCALRDHHCSIDDSRFLWYDSGLRENPSQPLPRSVLQDFIRHHMKDCSAVICQDDEIAYSLIRELQLLKIEIPQQISVVGFGNSYFSNVSPIRITTVSSGNTSLWMRAAHGLLQLMEDRPFADMIYPWTLVEKDSVSTVSS